MGLVRLAIDYENPSRDWWDAGGRELWDGITEGMGESAVVLEAHVAASWLSEAERLPGWDTGHEYAPHPIASREIGEDEELDA
jgi:nuclear transport factor 2 (NTF2) superfamily protein